MARPQDKIALESESGTLTTFNALEIVSDLSAPAQAVFNVGNDGTWNSIRDFVLHGKTFRVYLNDQLRMTGRVLSIENPLSASQGSPLTLMLRTKLADAWYASADPGLKFQGVSIKQFLLRLFRPLGYTEKDFVIGRADLERDLVTGVGARNAKAPPDLEPLKVEAAKVSPPESIYECATKQLKRFHLMLWDSPEGRIYVGAPDDVQRPLYSFRLKRRPNADANNVLDARRISDWSDVPSEINIYGGLGGKDIAKAPLHAVDFHLQLAAAGFHRNVVVIDESAKSLVQLDARVAAELARRSMRLDAWELEVDGWSYWDGSRAVPYAINTTAEVDIDAVDGARGIYYVHRLSSRENTTESRRSRLMLVKQGIYKI